MNNNYVKPSGMTRRAIVLSGGSIRGAFQAGALGAVLESGYKPDVIQGISAGALNGAFVVSKADRIGKQVYWENAAKELLKFWLDEIRKPQQIIQERHPLAIAFQVLRKRFKGLINPAPLKKLLKTHVDLANLSNSEVKFLVGAVNMLDGNIEYKTNKDNNIIDFILASASMPIIFPPVLIDNKLYYDGGIRDNAPLKHVIKEGVDEIVLILTQVDPMEKLFLGRNLKPGKVTHLISRSVNILLNDVLINDLKEMKKVNQDLIAVENTDKEYAPKRLDGKRLIRFKVIRPQKSYHAEINKFTPADIHEMVNDGYELGLKAMKTSFNFDAELSSTPFVRESNS